MLGYVTVGTNDLEKAAKFYDGIADILGHGRIREKERIIIWGTPGAGAMFAVIKPFDGEEASAGNGTMCAFAAANTDQVKQAHAYALANGATDDGAPGPRGESFYGGYFRDLDGNKVVVFIAG